MAFSWQKVIENNPAYQASLAQQRKIAETNAATQKIYDDMEAARKRELEGQLAQSAAKTESTTKSNALVTGDAAAAKAESASKDDAVRKSELAGLVDQSTAKTAGYIQSSTLIAGATEAQKRAQALAASASQLDQSTETKTESIGSSKAKRRTTLLAG